jgi:very-short-patch-repair endonuclease
MKQQNICFAKKLRYESTEAEKLVWRYLRARRLDGLKFRRQHPIGGYIADFVCLENRIIIEIDGGQHANEKNKDREREAWLKNQGFKVLRFWNNEVLENLEGILEVIRSNV